MQRSAGATDDCVITGSDPSQALRHRSLNGRTVVYGGPKGRERGVADEWLRTWY